MQTKLGNWLQTSKLAIVLEIVIIFLPFSLGLILSGRIGSDHISLGGNLIIIGGPLTYLGLVVSLIALWMTSRLRGGGLWINQLF